jgi:glycosyltransferase involved in cell wall biosynthesis
LIIKVNDLNDEVIKDKGNAYYIAFLTRSEPLKDLTTLIKALSRLVKEVNEWREVVLKEYRSL